MERRKEEKRNGDDGAVGLAKQLELYTRSPASSREAPDPVPISDKSAQKGTELKAKARERKKTEFDVKCICLRKWTCATWGVPQRLWDAVSLSHLAKTAIGQSAGEKGRAG
jgi:hypothetical protein